MFTNRKELMTLFYRVTENGFYTGVQLSQIMHLIAYAGGDTANTAEHLLEQVREISKMGITDAVSCRNALMVARILNGSEEQIAFLQALSDYYGKNQRAHSNEGAWRRFVMTAEDPFIRAFYEYAHGNGQKAIASFEKALLCDEDEYYALQLLAVVCCDEALDEKALEYALRALWIDKDCKVEHPSMEKIERECSRRLGKKKSDEILARISHAGTEKNKIGFV